MQVKRVLQNFYMVERVEEKSESKIILPQIAKATLTTTFARVIMAHGEYSSYGVKHVPLAEPGDLVLVLTTLEGNLSFEVEGKKVFLVPDNAIIAIVDGLDIDDSAAEGLSNDV